MTSTVVRTLSQGQLEVLARNLTDAQGETGLRGSEAIRGDGYRVAPGCKRENAVVACPGEIRTCTASSCDSCSLKYEAGVRGGPEALQIINDSIHVHICSSLT
jgi:hypothetical protein